MIGNLNQANMKNTSACAYAYVKHQYKHIYIESTNINKSMYMPVHM